MISFKQMTEATDIEHNPEPTSNNPTRNLAV